MQYSTTTLALHTQGIIEFWLDGKHYFGGDMYSYGRAALSLHLTPATHRLDLRLVRDSRTHGAVGEPTLEAKLRLEGRGPLVTPVVPERGDGPFNPYASALLPDMVDGSFVSPYASVALRNDAEHDAVVYSVTASEGLCLAELIGDPVRLVSGQTRPIPFRVVCVPAGRTPIRLFFHYKIDGSPAEKFAYYQILPSHLEQHQPQKITYLHPSGIVSYAILRPPSTNAHCAGESNLKAPTLLVLHGAGVEASGDEMRHALDGLPDVCAWTLIPSGVTPWCGDDWHQWGLADAEAAIAAVPHWIKDNDWQGIGVDVTRWLVLGHSNGGQGAWYTITHRPDKIIAAAPLSGYSSIQNYVPYTLWQNAEPARLAVLDGALGSYKHELLVDNLKGIQVLLQHGSMDDNVPPCHSRLMTTRLEQAGVESEYIEVPEMPHWWDGIMTTDPIKRFVQEHLNSGESSLREQSLVEEMEFTLVDAGHGDQASKNGIRILQTVQPGRLAKVRVTIENSECVLETSNALSLQLSAVFAKCVPLHVDGGRIDVAAAAEGDSYTLLREEGQWTIVKTFANLPPRRGRQLGGMDAIFRSEGPFQIVHLTDATRVKSLQISRNLYQYLYADTIITNDYAAATATKSNVITIATGTDLLEIAGGNGHPISIADNQLQLKDLGGFTQTYPLTRKGLGAIFLRPLPHERLELVVWGADEEGLDIAARLVPMMTGSGQPNFVVVDSAMPWKGVQGALAMGWFDAWWNISRDSFIA